MKYSFFPDKFCFSEAPRIFEILILLSYISRVSIANSIIYREFNFRLESFANTQLGKIMRT